MTERADDRSLDLASPENGPDRAGIIGYQNPVEEAATRPLVVFWIQVIIGFFLPLAAMSIAGVIATAAEMGSAGVLFSFAALLVASTVSFYLQFALRGRGVVVGCASFVAMLVLALVIVDFLILAGSRGDF